MKACPGCKTIVAGHVRRCPECGARLPVRVPKLVVHLGFIAGLLGVLGFLWVTFAGDRATALLRALLGD